MGRSIGPPSVSTEGRIVHKLSGSTITVHTNASGMEHRLEHAGLVADYPIAYSVGAGAVGYSYIVRLGPFLFQSPASYYAQAKLWELTPGYENDSRVDFTHSVTDGCLFCHTGSVNRIAGKPNQFGDPPFTPISCERCHGLSSAHLANPVAGNIANPAKLYGARRDSVCEQCHLEGAVRVLNSGRNWWDFQAGESEESVFVTYVSQKPLGDSVRAVSQSELLAQSQCVRQSGGQLWCGSCHSPHINPLKTAATVTQVCLTCHESLFAAKLHPAATECVSCHMPRLRASNVAHSAVTDHSIPRKPRRQPLDSRSVKVEVTAAELKAWREPDSSLVSRDLGVAAFDVAANTKSPSDAVRAYEILSRLPPEKRTDPVVEADLAAVLLAQGDAKIAVELFAQAATQQPSNSRYRYCLGVALDRIGKRADAIKLLQQSIRLDPSQPDPYLALSELYRKAGQKAESRNVLTDYLQIMPQNIQLRSMPQVKEVEKHAD